MKKVTNIAWMFALVLLTFLGSCGKYSNEDCTPSDSCNPYPIDSGYIYINLTYNGSGPGVPVVLYQGYVEDNVILWADTVYEEELVFWLPVSQRYAAEAYYNLAGQTTIALDGKKLTESSYDDCGTKCYTVAEIELDVKKL